MDFLDFSLIETETDFRHPRMEELLDIVHNHENDLDEMCEALFELAELLPAEDGRGTESPWHRAARNLLIEVLVWNWRDRSDFYVGGNLPVYYFKRPCRYPVSCRADFFCVMRVDRHLPRNKWVHWTEQKFPHVVLEFSSPRTAQLHRTTKKAFYERQLEVKEYFLYDPVQHTVEGWRLQGPGRYQPIQANENGWLRSDQLNLWLGNWKGSYQGEGANWPRFYDASTNLLPTQAEEATQRADALEQELTFLRLRLAQLERNIKNG